MVLTKYKLVKEKNQYAANLSKLCETNKRFVYFLWPFVDSCDVL